MKHVREELRKTKVIKLRPFFVRSKVIGSSGSVEEGIDKMPEAALPVAYINVGEALEYYKKLLGVFALVLENPADPRISMRTLAAWAEKYKGRLDSRFLSLEEVNLAYETVEKLQAYVSHQKRKHPLPANIELPIDDDAILDAVAADEDSLEEAAAESFASVEDVENDSPLEDVITLSNEGSEDEPEGEDLSDLFADLDDQHTVRTLDAKISDFPDAPSPFDEDIEDFSEEEIAGFEDAEDNGYPGREESLAAENLEEFSGLFSEDEEPLVTSALADSITQLEAPPIDPMQALLQSPNTATRRIFRASGRKHARPRLP